MTEPSDTMNEIAQSPKVADPTLDAARFAEALVLIVRDQQRRIEHAESRLAAQRLESRPSQEISEADVERVGEALRQECLAVFGSTWSNDVAWRFARAALQAAQKDQP